MQNGQQNGPRNGRQSGLQDGQRQEAGRPVRYVCMPGCAYTGSTLLGFLMNAHPECASIGAATGLIPGTDLETYTCSCGARFVDCRFWRRVGARTRVLGYPVDVYETRYWSTNFAPTGNRYIDAVLVRSLRSPALERLRDGVLGRLPPIRRMVEKPGSRSWALARAILEESGKRVFIDTGRDHQRPKLLARHPELDVRAIHLVRDVRANTASMLKHGTTRDVAEAARIWRRANEGADASLRELPEERRLRILYHELCSDLQGTLDRISDFLGVARAAMPADFRAVDHHIIGNEMRLGSAGEVREDVSWKQRLSESDLDIIARVAGETNRAFGFDWPA